jgi:hypothetical protein
MIETETAVASEMTVTCARDELTQALGVVSRAVSTRTAVQVLLGVRLQAEDGRLHLAATDMELSLRASIEGGQQPVASRAAVAQLEEVRRVGPEAGEQPRHERVLVRRADQQRVGCPFAADGGGSLTTRRRGAERPATVGRVDRQVVGQRQQPSGDRPVGGTGERLGAPEKLMLASGHSLGKTIKGIARLEIIDENVNGNSSARKNERSAHDFGIA